MTAKSYNNGYCGPAAKAGLGRHGRASGLGDGREGERAGPGRGIAGPGLGPCYVGAVAPYAHAGAGTAAARRAMRCDATPRTRQACDNYYGTASKGIAEDEAAGRAMFEEAADLGHPEAQFQLGRCCELGKGGLAKERCAGTAARQIVRAEQPGLELPQRVRWPAC